MYLSDTNIKEKLSELKIECSNPEEQFNTEEQIQPCSIDLKLDRVFWKPRKAGTIDLRKSKLFELSPRRYWKKIILSKGECITLQPGKLLLGRIYEKFTIPQDCAGKIEGRSSFARMGLGIHISGDFINPGYRGHMPLQLVNYGSNPIKIFPYVPICQLMLVRLSTKPQRVYGERELQSKYMDDDGGPSYWWRDKQIKKLQKKFTENDMALRVQEEILGEIGIREPEIIERFKKFVSKLKKDDLENVNTVLELFVKSEKKSEKKEKILRGLGYSIFPIFTSGSIGSIFIEPISIIHYVIWGLTIVSLPFFIYSITGETKEYLGEKDIKTSESGEG